MAGSTMAAELEVLLQRLLEMGERSEIMVERSILALRSLDEGLARRTIVLDRQVNQDEIEIDALATSLILRGGHDETGARLILAVTKAVVDLERISDLSVDICELALAMEETGIPGDLEEIQRISEIVREMLATALRAFRDCDPDAAQAVIARDDDVDRAYRVLFTDLFTRMAQGSSRLHLFLPEQNVAKLLERMADHATNVAEQAIFLANGADVRHRGKRL
jgi:phosphate transport system protein